MRHLINLLISALHIIISIALLLCCLNAYISPLQNIAFSFLALAFPVLLIVHILFCIYWLWQAKHQTYIFALVLVLLAWPIYRWIGYSSTPSPQDSDIKLISYNIHSFHQAAYPQGWTYLHNSQADIIALQESSDGAGRDILREKYPYQLHEMVVSLYSQHPIIHHKKVLDTSTNGHVLLADIKIKDKIYRIINVYLNPFCITKNLIKPSDRATTMANYRQVGHMLSDNIKVHVGQVEKIMAELKASPYPVILLGDLNSVPNSYEYYQFSGILNDAFLQAGQGSATSFHDFGFPLRLDYAFTSPDLKVVSYDIRREINYSDHYPLWLSIRP